MLEGMKQRGFSIEKLTKWEMGGTLWTEGKRPEKEVKEGWRHRHGNTEGQMRKGSNLRFLYFIISTLHIELSGQNRLNAYCVSVVLGWELQVMM